MASKQPVWGIDIGQCSLKAVQLQASETGVELVGFDFIEHEQILSQSEADAAEMMRKAIETFASRNDLSKSKVVVSVAGQQTLTKFTKMPPVEAKKIPDMVQYEASQQIPFDMDEVVWDYQVFTEGEAAEVEVGIFAIRKELIRNYLSMFTSQQVEPVMVQTSPMASYNAARYEIPLPDGETFILLDMGALATDLIVVSGNRIWARALRIGGNLFTEALVSAFKVPFKKAEKLKRTAASSKYARQIFQAMRPVFADLVSEVQRSVGFYTSTHRDAHITRIIGMGNAFKLPGLQKFLQQSVQMKVEKFPGFAKLVEVNNPKKAEFEENQMSLGVAYGLAIQGLGLASVNSNLLPIELRKTLLWQKKKPWFISSAACLALSAGAIFAGNAMASGDISKSLDGLKVDDLRLQTFSSVDAAESAIKSSGGGPLQRAMQVGGAAKFLKTEYNKYTSDSKDVATLKLLARFPENNRFVPQIVDVVHRTFEEVLSPELKSAKTSVEYLRLAERIPRTERKEAYLDSLLMYYEDDPGERFQKNADEQARRGRPGWAIEVNGITTQRNPARWLEESIKKTMLELGSEPNKGFYFESIAITKVSQRDLSSARTTDIAESGTSASGSSNSGGGSRAGGRGTGTRGGGARNASNQRGEGGGRSVGGGSAGTRGLETAGMSGDLQKLFSGYKDKDPLTMEDLSTDYEFKLEIIVRRENTPNDRIPERFKEKKEEPPKTDAPKKG